ncbi:MAG: 50S ribosome-binding GTPase, partial [Thermoguttaceae bacterium]|nr:50S ribosome-binding GTPase [Thermoguttaceae bacterium]
MIDKPWESLKRQAERLREKSALLMEGLGGQYQTGEIWHRLDLALQRAERLSDAARPMHVVLMGGTGVGKSALFNALVQKPNASPESHLRACTRMPHVAVHPQEAPLIEFPPEYQVVPFEKQGLVVCDTPDLDSILRQHRQTTQKLLEKADLVVWITDPDKRANFAIHQQIRQWASRAHWLFVMNKIDLHQQDKEAIREDFESRLREIGFTPQQDNLFLLSARQVEQYDFPRFRELLFAPRSAEERLLLRGDVFLRYLLHATEPELLQELEALIQTLEEQATALTARLEEAFVAALNRQELKEAFQRVLS